MKLHRAFVLAAMIAWGLGGWGQATAQPLQMASKEEQTVRTAVSVLDEIMAIPAKQVPASLLSDAHGVAIIPNVVKGGFVVGARHGRGVVLIRGEAGQWQAPVFVSLTGGSVGWQAGLQATDVILVFRTARSVQGLMQGKLTIGVDAAAAAGPVGRQAAASTDERLAAEILSYSRSRGLFAGVSIDGSVLKVDHQATSLYYGRAPGLAPNQPPALPQSAVQLINRLAQYSGAPEVLVSEGPTLAPPQVGPAIEAEDPELIRDELAGVTRQLYALVDPSWQRFLSVPLGTAAVPPTLQEVEGAIARFNSIAESPQYAALSQRPEFVATQRLLSEYLQARTSAGSKLSLPAPPPGGITPEPIPQFP